MRNRFQRALDHLRVLSWWIQIHPYSAAWDKKLSWLLDNGYRFDDIDAYHATIGDYRVWIANHPYGSFTFRELRPRRVTILRAWRVLEQDREQATAQVLAVPQKRLRAVLNPYNEN